MMLLPYLTKLYDAYVDTYREADGSLPVMMQLKRTHTAFVVKNAELIADGEGFTPEEREVAFQRVVGKHLQHGVGEAAGC